MPRTKNGGWGRDRPAEYSECAGAPRPCPWIGCKYHILVDVFPTGSVRACAGEQAIRVDGRGRKRTATIKRPPPALGVDESKTVAAARLDGLEAAVMKRLHEALVAEESLCTLDYADEFARRGEGGESVPLSFRRACATLEEIGRIFRVSRERIRQIEVMGLAKARPVMAEILET